MKFLSIFRRKSVIRCCIRDCNSKAEYSAGVKRMISKCMGQSVSGTIRPLCGAKKCLNIMKRVEQTNQITLTPIGSSIYSVTA